MPTWRDLLDALVSPPSVSPTSYVYVEKHLGQGSLIGKHQRFNGPGSFLPPRKVEEEDNLTGDSGAT